MSAWEVEEVAAIAGGGLCFRAAGGGRTACRLVAASIAGAATGFTGAECADFGAGLFVPEGFCVTDCEA